MGEITGVIQAIFNGVKSPVKAGIGALLALFLYLFFSVQKGKFRAKKAESEKEDQKGESNVDLENSSAEGDSDIRDRMNRR